jgi:hypothetical protein
VATLTDISADGRLEARYLNDRRGVLMRAKFTGKDLYSFDFEPFAQATYGDTIVSPTVRASATAFSNSGTTTVVPLPSGWQPGDLCYICYSLLSSSPSMATPAGWSARVAMTASGQNANLVHGVYKRILQAGDGSVTITRASGRFAAISVAIYDYDPTTPEDVNPVTDSNSGVTGSSVRAPSITSTRDNCLLITSHCVRNGTSGVTNMSYTPPPGMTEVADVASTSTSTNTALEVVRLTLGSAAAAGTKIATLAGSKITDIQRVGSSIVVRPKVVPATSFAGGFAWKHIGSRGTHSMNYNPPGTNPSALQWCSTMIKSDDNPIIADTSVPLAVSGVSIPAVSQELPQVRSASEVSTGSSTTATTLTVTLPAGWQAGDLCYIPWGLSATSASLTVPSGWTEIIPQTYASGSTTGMMGVLRRVLQAGDSNPVLNFTSGRAVAIAVAIYGYDPAFPEDVTPLLDPSAGSMPNCIAESLTPVTINCLLITTHVVRNSTNNIINMAMTPPAGMTEIHDIANTSTGSNNVINVCQQALTTLDPTGAKTATVTGSDVTTGNRMAVSILIRPKVPVGSSGSTGVSGAAVTVPFNIPANTLVAAMVGYNAATGDAAGDKVTISNDKGITVTPGVSRDHRDGSQNGGTKIAYMWSSGAQTGMTVTATLAGVDLAVDDVVMKVLLINNVDWLNLTPDGNFEGSSQDNSMTVTMQSDLVGQGIALWAVMDGVTKGTPVITEPSWTAISPSTVSKTAVTPITGQQSLLNSWTSGQQGIRWTLPTSEKGEKSVRLWFKVLGTEELSSTWPKSQTARLEVLAYNTSNRLWKTNVLGFPGNIERYWFTDFFIPKGDDLAKIEIITYGWDSSAAARFDDIKLEEIVPDYVRFARKTDGGYVRGGDPAQAVQGVAYAFDDELVPNQATEWYAEPIFPNGAVGSVTGEVGFTIEDRSVDLPSTMIKSVETPGLIIFVPTQQNEFTRSRSTTFVNKQTTGKPAGGVNSAFSASGDYQLITKTIVEMNDLITILDETVLYISPTGRYNRKPFYATVSEYTILDFARMDGQEKVFAIQFQEVERPDTEGQGNYLPLRDYGWLATQYDTYNDPDLTSLTYDQLAFSTVA